MNLLLVVLLSALAVTRAAPVPQDVPLLVNQFSPPDQDGKYSFRYELGDGTSHMALGSNNGDGIPRVQGRYSYTSPEGEKVDVIYVADENGYRTYTGDQVPPDFARALAEQHSEGDSADGTPSGAALPVLKRTPQRRGFDRAG